MVNKFENSLNKLVKDNKLVVSNKSNNLGQKLAESKKLKNHQNFTKNTIVSTKKYWIPRAKKTLTQLKQTFTKVLIF